MVDSAEDLEEVAMKLDMKTKLNGVEKWMDGTGPAAKSFRDALAVGDDLAVDLTIVVGAVSGLLKSGLTRRAICVLAQDQMGKGPGGRPKMSVEDIDSVLGALEDLKKCLTEAKK